MSVLSVPALEETPWPSLGWLLVPWMEKNLVFGPGDLRGEPLRLDDERKALIYRLYEVYPEGHEKAGRRRFRRGAISVRKGVGKTELLAIIAAAELSPTAPVRCIGLDKLGRPLGGPVKDAYIPLVAYTEEQSEDLAYGALKVILELSPIADQFDIGMERILRKETRRAGAGKAVALAGAPDARDGARTTFQGSDETHRWNTPKLRNAHRTMMANLPKRKLADAWGLETTTSPAPGENSVAESTMEYARAVADGRRVDSDLFFFHRQAADDADLSTPEGVRAAVLEASGPTADWSNIDAIVAQFFDPTSDLSYLRRVWLNQLVRATERAFDVERWRGCVRPEYGIPDGALVALGFDGSRRQDSTALVATEISTGHQELVKLWERPLVLPEGETWEVPVAEVNEAIEAAFARWNVWRLYADPPYWETQVDEWAGKYTEDRVVKWSTRLWRKMADAVRAYVNAIAAGELTHNGDERLTRHVGNAHRMELQYRHEDGHPLYVIQKSQKDSPNKIDAAVAGVLSWQARRDALAAGAGNEGPSLYDQRAADGQAEVIDSWG